MVHVSKKIEAIDRAANATYSDTAGDADLSVIFAFGHERLLEEIKACWEEVAFRIDQSRTASKFYLFERPILGLSPMAQDVLLCVLDEGERGSYELPARINPENPQLLAAIKEINQQARIALSNINLHESFNIVLRRGNEISVSDPQLERARSKLVQKLEEDLARIEAARQEREREAEILQKVANLKQKEANLHLSEILGEIVHGPHGSQKIAAENLGITPTKLNKILHGRQPVPIDCLDKNSKDWEKVFQTPSYVRSWKEREFEFKSLLDHVEYLSQIPNDDDSPIYEDEDADACSADHKRAMQPRITLEFSLQQRQNFGRLVRALRREHGDTISNFLIQTENVEITPSVFGQIEEGNPRIHSDRLLGVFNGACKLYSQNIQLSEALYGSSDKAVPRTRQRNSLVELAP